MAPVGQYEHPFYNIAQNVFGGRERDEALKLHQDDLALERARRLLLMKQDVENQEAERQARLLGEGMGRMAPSTTVVNPNQPGPVLQEPSMDIPGVTSPMAPSSLADTFFPGPQKATFGDEALRPQAAPYYPEVQPKQPGQEWRDVYSKDWAAGVEPPPARPTPPETVSETTGAEPEVPQRPLPSTPATFRAGGTREEVPGMALDQLLREQPAAGAAVLQNRKAVAEAGEADVEATGRKAVQAYVRARKSGVSEEKAYDDYGAAMEASKFGQNFLTSIGVREEKEIARKTKERALEKETQAQEYLTARVAQLRQSDDPKDHARADMLEEFSKDPKLAERTAAFDKAQAEQEANRLKAEELKKKPIEIGGVGYAWGKNAEGQDVLQVIPGQQVKPGKSKWEGITLNELDAMIENPATSPEDRAIAERTAARAEKRAVKVAAAGAPPKPTQQSEAKQQERLTLTNALVETRDWVVKHPEWVGGVMGSRAWVLAQAYDAPDSLKGTAAWLAKFPPGYDEFRSTMGLFTAEKLNELAGAALTPGEVKRYGAFLPNVYGTPERMRASIEVSLKMMEAATAYQTARDEGASVAEAQTRARAAIRRVAMEHVQKYGDPAAGAKPGGTAADIAKDLGIPQTRPTSPPLPVAP